MAALAEASPARCCRLATRDAGAFLRQIDETNVTGLVRMKRAGKAKRIWPLSKGICVQAVGILVAPDLLIQKVEAGRNALTASLAQTARHEQQGKQHASMQNDPVATELVGQLAKKSLQRCVQMRNCYAKHRQRMKRTSFGKFLWKSPTRNLVPFVGPARTASRPTERESNLPVKAIDGCDLFGFLGGRAGQQAASARLE